MAVPSEELVSAMDVDSEPSVPVQDQPMVELSEEDKAKKAAEAAAKKAASDARDKELEKITVNAELPNVRPPRTVDPEGKPPLRVALLVGADVVDEPERFVLTVRKAETCRYLQTMINDWKGMDPAFGTQEKDEDLFTIPLKDIRPAVMRIILEFIDHVDAPGNEITFEERVEEDEYVEASLKCAPTPVCRRWIPDEPFVNKHFVIPSDDPKAKPQYKRSLLYEVMTKSMYLDLYPLYHLIAKICAKMKENMTTKQMRVVAGVKDPGFTPEFIEERRKAGLWNADY